MSGHSAIFVSLIKFSRKLDNLIRQTEIYLAEKVSRKFSFSTRLRAFQKVSVHFCKFPTISECFLRGRVVHFSGRFDSICSMFPHVFVKLRENVSPRYPSGGYGGRFKFS